MAALALVKPIVAAVMPPEDVDGELLLVCGEERLLADACAEHLPLADILARVVDERLVVDQRVFAWQSKSVKVRCKQFS